MALSALIFVWQSLLILKLSRKLFFSYFGNNNLNLTSIIMSHYYDDFGNYYNNCFNTLLSYFSLAPPIFSFNFILSFHLINNFSINFINFSIANNLYYSYCNCKLLWMIWSIIDKKPSNLKHMQTKLLLRSFCFLQFSSFFSATLSVFLL